MTAPKRFLGGFRVATLHTLGRVGNVSLQELKLKTRSMENIEALVMHLQQQKNRIDELNLAFKRKSEMSYKKFGAKRLCESYTRTFYPHNRASGFRLVL